uniref:Uncharacterized protein n=1 Tax=Ixodes scapularis TaxID=6945 RepID=A0A1S4LEL0_IXOSC
MALSTPPVVAESTRPSTGSTTTFLGARQRAEACDVALMRFGGDDRRSDDDDVAAAALLFSKRRLLDRRQHERYGDHHRHEADPDDRAKFGSARVNSSEQGPLVDVGAPRWRHTFRPPLQPPRNPPIIPPRNNDRCARFSLPTSNAARKSHVTTKVTAHDPRDPRFLHPP